MIKTTRVLNKSYRLWWAPGCITLIVMFLMVGLPLVALIKHSAPDFTSLLSNQYLRKVIIFTFYQATLSTLISVGLAIPIALALSRQYQFPGRTILLNLFSVSLIIPTIVAIFGIVAVYGHKGWLNKTLELSGADWQLPFYGLPGILLGHVFFNLPLSVRIMLQSLDAISTKQWRLATELGFTRSSVFRFLEWPAIRPQLSGLCLLVFSLCFTSFAIVLTLGGGPRATTIEVAIYQALRFDFDLATATTLALLQLVICSSLIVLASMAGRPAELLLSKSKSPIRFFKQRRIGLICDATLILTAFVFIVTPLIALFLAAINPAFWTVLTSLSTLKATGNTLIVAISSGILSVSLSLCLLISVRHLKSRTKYTQLASALEMSGFVILIIPPIVLGTGLFLLLRNFADIFSLALVLVILVNAIMGLPFAIRILQSPFLQIALRYDRLCMGMGITGINRVKIIEWPLLRKPLGLALAITTTLSAGDLTVIALFGSERLSTLPLLLYQRMGSYRMFEAAVTAALLLVLCLVLFRTIERIVGGTDGPKRQEKEHA